jgi:hypothetical protein
MRVSITPAFSKFLMDNNTVYPYSNLKPTRNSFYCKWVMAKGNALGIEEFFPVLANSFPNSVLLELISSGALKPFPPELSAIMDTMHWWGRQHSNEWYEGAICILHESLESPVEEDKMELVRALLSIQVRIDIHSYFAVDSMQADLLWIDWIRWFNANYRNGPKKSFHKLSVYNFDYVKWAMAQVTVRAPVPERVNSTTT